MRVYSLLSTGSPNLTQPPERHSSPVSLTLERTCINETGSELDTAIGGTRGVNRIGLSWDPFNPRFNPDEGYLNPDPIS